jgi:hypothetical protein
MEPALYIPWRCCFILFKVKLWLENLLEYFCPELNPSLHLIAKKDGESVANQKFLWNKISFHNTYKRKSKDNTLSSFAFWSIVPQ